MVVYQITTHMSTNSADITAEYITTVLTAFYGAKGNVKFGNFYLRKLKYNGLVFECAESAFQAAKCANPIDRQKFVGLDGDAAFHLGRSVSMRSDWHQVKRSTMKEILTAKFQDFDLRTALAQTGSAYIIEHNERKGRDTFWSDDFDGTGQNVLGQILMEIRTDLCGIAQPLHCPAEYDNIIKSKPFPSAQNNCPTCLKPGCSRPTWNGQPGEFCSFTCRNGSSQQGPTCLKPGCNKLTWNGQPGEYCSFTCRNGISPQSFQCARPGCTAPPHGNIRGNCCGLTCRRAHFGY